MIVQQHLSCQLSQGCALCRIRSMGQQHFTTNLWWSGKA